MVSYVLFNYITRHSVAHCPGEVPVIPHFSGPKAPFQPRELAKQLPRTYAFEHSYDLPYRSFRWKRQHDMYMVSGHLKLDKIQFVFFANFSKQLFRSFPYFVVPENVAAPLRTPHKMVSRFINRMTRSLQCHALCYCRKPARANSGKGRLPSLPLQSPPVRHAFIPAASRGGFSKGIR